MRTIELKNGGAAWVDDEDFVFLNQYKWRRTTGGYAATISYPKSGDRKETPMARLIMAPVPPRKEVDHSNGDKLDNRRQNLRICTPSQNSSNRGKKAGSHTSQYKGVSWHKHTKQWASRINQRNCTINIGYFRTERAAAMAYDIAARDLHAEFARYNFQPALP
jgi:hypothetical protein